MAKPILEPYANLYVYAWRHRYETTMLMLIVHLQLSPCYIEVFESETARREISEPQHPTRRTEEHDLVPQPTVQAGENHLRTVASPCVTTRP